MATTMRCFWIPRRRRSCREKPARPPIHDCLPTESRTNTFEELGGKSWIAAWEDWIANLNRALSAKGIPLIPNVGGLVTTWDNTNYSLTAGVFSEGFLDPGFTTEDWRAAADQTLALVRGNKIVILQNYLPSANDVARRRFLLASYLLVKGGRTYSLYLASDSLEWYPEWDLDLGPRRRAPSPSTT
jgi:hypothetical protein